MKTIIEAKQPMHAPSHPGEVLSSMYLEPMGVSVTEAANALGVSRKHVSAIVNGGASVTPDMAKCLGIVFGPDTAFWINLQAQYDVWIAERKPTPKWLKRMEVA
jgi:addiction module HigA family antidote